MQYRTQHKMVSRVSSEQLAQLSDQTSFFFEGYQDWRDSKETHIEVRTSDKIAGRGGNELKRRSDEHRDTGSSSGGTFDSLSSLGLVLVSGLLVFLLSRLDRVGSVSMLLLVALFALVHLVAMSLRLGRVGMVLRVSRGSLLTLLVVPQRLSLLSTLLLRLDLIFLLVTLGLLTALLEVLRVGGVSRLVCGGLLLTLLTLVYAVAVRLGVFRLSSMGRFVSRRLFLTLLVLVHSITLCRLVGVLGRLRVSRVSRVLRMDRLSILSPLLVCRTLLVVLLSLLLLFRLNLTLFGSLCSYEPQKRLSSSVITVKLSDRVLAGLGSHFVVKLGEFGDLRAVVRKESRAGRVGVFELVDEFDELRDFALLCDWRVSSNDGERKKNGGQEREELHCC